MLWLSAIVVAYLVGSIPVGVLLGRLKGVDIRTQGSRNIGATNVGRVLGRRLGLLCFVLDVIKGLVPVGAAGLLAGVWGSPPSTLTALEQWAWLVVAAAAITGHCASIFLRGAGGKGVATSFGAMLALWPLLTVPVLGALLVWIVTVRVTRYVSVASIAAALSVPLLYVGWIAWRFDVETLRHCIPPAVVTAALAAYVVWKHRANIGRLRRGEEPKRGTRVAG